MAINVRRGKFNTRQKGDVIPDRFIMAFCSACSHSKHCHTGKSCTAENVNCRCDKTHEQVLEEWKARR